jgi:D-glycero-D-manno-heptose 1,7-bisphosphate phosphatase
MRRAVFLDRDGVISVPEFRDGRSYAPTQLADFHLYTDAAGAIARLRRAGFLVIVVTNQPDVGAGLVARETVEAMHEQMRIAALVDDIETCFETRAQASERRKPGPGMLLDAAAKWGIDLGASYMVGDRAGDIEAGRRAGCRASVFIDRGYTNEPNPLGEAARVANLDRAVDWILTQGETQ